MKTNEFKPTKGMITAAEAVFQTMATVQVIEPIVKGYQRKILEEGRYPYDAKNFGGRRGEVPADHVSDPDHTYLMGNKDFKHYLARCNEEREKARLHVDNPEFCPLLVARELQRKAERLLVESMEPITHLTADKILCSKDGLENYRKVVDLTLRLLAPHVRSTNNRCAA